MLQVIICVHCVVAGYAQSSETFIVKKKATTAVGHIKIGNWKLGPAEDTICNSVMIDLTTVQGMYDSISVVNMRLIDSFYANTLKRIYATTNHTGHAIITFFRKQPDNTYTMVYFRNWVIACRNGQRQ
ncbi:MAG TPA: hypothetical protein VK174_16100 [Chitinophagales bacterium]|nr:hypothetical protein [Chitinophagales bacterium]